MSAQLQAFYDKGLGNLSDAEQKMFVKLLNAEEARKYEEALIKTNHDLFDFMAKNQL